MNYAIVKIGNEQYKICEGDELGVSKIEGKIKDKIILQNVLMFCEDGKITIGRPTLEKVKATAEIVKQYKEEKIRISKYRAKTRFRKVRGHKQDKTKIKILKIKAN